MTRGKQIVAFRGVDRDVWLSYREHCVKTGQKVGDAITRAMRRDIRRMEAEDRAARRRKRST